MHYPIPIRIGVPPRERRPGKLNGREALRLFGFLAASSFLSAGAAALAIHALFVARGDFGAAVIAMRKAFGAEDGGPLGWLFWHLFWGGMTAVWLGCGLGVTRRPMGGGYCLGLAKVDFDESGRSMRLAADLAFRGSRGRLWSAPRGSVCHGDALPAGVWRILGPPYLGVHREATIIHEHYCRMKAGLPRDVHQMFYEACRARGVPEAIAKMARWELEVHGPVWGQEMSREEDGGARNRTSPLTNLKERAW